MTDTPAPLRILFDADIPLTRDQIGWLLAEAEAAQRCRTTLEQWDASLEDCKDAFDHTSMYGAGVRSLATAAQDLRTALDGTMEEEKER